MFVSIMLLALYDQNILGSVLTPGILCEVLNYINYIPLLKMMLRRDVAGKYLADVEMDDE